MSADLSAYKSFTASQVQKTEQFTVYLATFKSPLPDGRTQAWVKIFNTNSPDAERETAILMHLSEFPLQAVKYLKHFSAKGRLYLFLQKCDDTLATEISLRSEKGRYWTEAELRTHLLDLTKTVFKLHAMRVVHRNICPQTVFVCGEKLVLGNFDDAKQVGLGVSLAVESVRGSTGYLPPGVAHSLLVQKKTSTYRTSFKDDVWGLGRLMLDMATLRWNCDIERWFQLSQEMFSTQVAELIRKRYSRRFVGIVCSMLTLNDDQRPSVADVLDMLDTGTLRCSNCDTEVEGSQWACGHFYCNGCLFVKLREQLVNVAEPRAITCKCGESVPNAFLNAVEDERTQVIISLLRKPYGKCPCGAQYPRIQSQNDRISPYIYSCTCRQRYCSYCEKPNGHSLLGVKRACPTFPGI